MPPALVVSSGLPGLAVTRALGEQGVPVVVLYFDDDDLAAVSRYAEVAIRVPRPEQDGKLFVRRLLELSGDFAGAVLFPTSDAAVKDIAMAKPELGRHYQVACPAWDVAVRYIDKWHTYRLAEQIGVAAPQSLAPRTAADLETYSGPYPCLIKPRESHLYHAIFQEKVTVVESPGELHDAWHRADAAGLEVLIQELIPGPDGLGVNYNALRLAGEVRVECTARKVRLSPPRFGFPRVVLSEHVPEVLDAGRKILAALDYEGFACTEFKWDERTGTYKLLEVNGRPNLSSLLSVRCGINFPWLLYRYLVTGALPGPLPARTGIYWIDESAELAHSTTRQGRDSQGPREILRPWTSPHVFAVFDRKDARPFANVMRGMARGAGRRLRRGVGSGIGRNAASD